MLHREDDEIRKLREEWPNMSYEDKVDKFLWKMVWFHHEKHISRQDFPAICLSCPERFESG